MFLFASPLYVQAQTDKEKTCASDIMNKLLLKQHPLLRYKKEQIENLIYIKSDKNNPHFQHTSQSIQ